MNRLLEAAKKARTYAYVPYSRFAVGAAVRTSEQIVTGANVENASYGLTTCAERIALFKAVSEGERDFQGLAVIADTKKPVVPCGACRQVLVELCSRDMKIWLANLTGQVMETTVGELLPHAFQKDDLHA